MECPTASLLLFTLCISSSEAQHARGFFAPPDQNPESLLLSNRNAGPKSFQRQEPIKNSFQQQYTSSNVIRNPGFAQSAAQKSPTPFKNFQNGFSSSHRFNPQFPQVPQRSTKKSSFQQDNRFSTPNHFQGGPQFFLSQNSNAKVFADDNPSNVIILPHGSLNNNNFVKFASLEPKLKALRPQSVPQNFNDRSHTLTMGPKNVVRTVSINSHQGISKKESPASARPTDQAHFHTNGRNLVPPPTQPSLQLTKDQLTIQLKQLHPLKENQFRVDGPFRINEFDPNDVSQERETLPHELVHSPKILLSSHIKSQNNPPIVQIQIPTSTPSAVSKSLSPDPQKAFEIISFPSRSNEKKSLDSEIKKEPNSEMKPNTKAKTSGFEVDKEEYKAFMEWVKKNRHVMGPGASPATTISTFLPKFSSTTLSKTSTTQFSTSSPMSLTPSSTFRTIHLNSSPTLFSTTSSTQISRTTLPITTSLFKTTPSLLRKRPLTSSTLSTSSSTSTKSSFRPKFRNLKRIRNFNAKFRPKPTKYFQRFREQKISLKTTTTAASVTLGSDDQGNSTSTPVKPKYFLLNKSRRINKWRPKKKNLSRLRIHKSREGQANQQRERVVEFFSSSERNPFSFKIASTSSSEDGNHTNISGPNAFSERGTNFTDDGDHSKFSGANVFSENGTNPSSLSNITDSQVSSIISSPPSVIKSLLPDNSNKQVAIEEVEEIITTQDLNESSTPSLLIFEVFENLTTLIPSEAKLSNAIKLDDIAADISTPTAQNAEDRVLPSSLEPEATTNMIELPPLSDQTLTNSTINEEDDEFFGRNSSLSKNIVEEETSSSTYSTTPNNIKTSTVRPTTATTVEISVSTLPESIRRSDTEFPDFLKDAITMTDSLDLREVKVISNRTMNFSEGYAKSVVYS